jgi:hypothetical protein
MRFWCVASELSSSPLISQRLTWVGLHVSYRPTRRWSTSTRVTEESRAFEQARRATTRSTYVLTSCRPSGRHSFLRSHALQWADMTFASGGTGSGVCTVLDSTGQAKEGQRGSGHQPLHDQVRARSNPRYPCSPNLVRLPFVLQTVFGALLTWRVGVGSLCERTG